MGEDATRTLSALRRLRAELFGPSFAGHRGKLIKSMGDGWIVTFSSAVDAVSCAMRLQDKMADEPDIALRIGIHIGDITQEDEDVFGESVNVAARLEALTDPGGLTISDAVFSTLDGTLRPAFDDAGKHDLKNITRPVHLWTRGGVKAPSSARQQNATGFPRVQIVPVSLQEPHAPLADLAQALTHDLEACLVHVRWLQAAVMIDPAPGAFILKSTLRGSGDSIRFEARLAAPDGTPMWTRKYDGTLSDVFNWQDETGADAASRVSATIMEHTQAQLSQKDDNSLTGWEWLSKGAMMTDGSHAATAAILDYVVHAIEADPDLGYAYELALGMTASASSSGYADLVSKYQPMLDDWLERAKDLSTGTPSFQAILALYSYVQSGDVAAARTNLAANLRNLPFDPEALIFSGYVFNFIGEGQNALECFNKYHEIARHHYFKAAGFNGAGAACVLLGHYDQALVHLDKTLSNSPGYVAAYRWRAAALAQLGRLDEARAALAQHDALLADQTVTIVRAGSQYIDNEATARYFDGLRLAGMPD